MLEAFCKSLLQHGFIKPPKWREAGVTAKEYHPILCAGCASFLPDTGGDGTGLGKCKAGKGAFYPNQMHTCSNRGTV